MRTVSLLSQMALVVIGERNSAKCFGGKRGARDDPRSMQRQSKSPM